MKQLIARAIESARFAGKPIGICGQAPSDYPDFAAWLAEHEIDSVSLNPDTVIKTALVIAQAEQKRPIPVTGSKEAGAAEVSEDDRSLPGVIGELCAMLPPVSV